MPKLTQLPIKEFTSDMIDNCFYVDREAEIMYKVPMQSIFDWIKKEAENNNLSVEIKGDRIYFNSYRPKDVS